MSCGKENNLMKSYIHIYAYAHASIIQTFRLDNMIFSFASHISYFKSFSSSLLCLSLLLSHSFISELNIHESVFCCNKKKSELNLNPTNEFDTGTKKQDKYNVIHLYMKHFVESFAKKMKKKPTNIHSKMFCI